MKKILTFLWVLTMIQAASAQSFSPTAIVSAGNAVTTSDGTYISWSIGETFVTTLSGGDVILTQGFQQPGEEVDADGDGWLASEDCDDLNPMVFPGAAEFCNLMDDDCDGQIDDGVSNPYYYDEDGDGFGDYLTEIYACEAPPFYVPLNMDCIPYDGSIYPGAPEVCNNVDDNCDFQIDEGFDQDGDGYNVCSGDCDDNNPLNSPAIAELCDGQDNNCDAVIDEGFDNDSDGFTSCYGDCDDANPDANPFAIETCGNGIDEDCDGSDVSCGVDADGDGVLADEDCDDNNMDIYPGAPELCDQLDNDCNGLADDNLETYVVYADADNDDFGDISTEMQTCDVPVGYVFDNSDCDDANGEINPLAVEICDNVDNNCEGSIDEDLGIVQFADNDGDGYGNANVPSESCFLLPGFVENSDDCDDENASINSMASEVCDGIDNNCDGVADEGLQVYTLYADADGDGYGDMTNSITTCNPTQAGFVGDDSDCNDLDATMNVMGVEVCGDGIDHDCDGADLICPIPGCIDETACNFDPAANVDNGTCEYPSAEVCDDLDNDCDGIADNGLEFVDYFADVDGDGYGADLIGSFCQTPIDGLGVSAMDGDCDDSNANINPVAEEVCNQVDDNCNDLVDEGLTFVDYFADVDGDGYGSELIGNLCENPGGNAVVLGGDCNETNTNLNPGMDEACNQIDDNCNGQIDEGLTVGDVTATQASTALYPTCTSGNLFSANLNNGADSPIIPGNGPDLWYRFTAQNNAFRASLSAATGNNTIYLYQNAGGCFTMLALENETVNNQGQPIANGNQTLYSSSLVTGNEYYVAVHQNSGNINASAKLCLNHYVGSVCDHVYSNNSGIYNSVCSSFKAQFKANASNYIFNVLSATQGGGNLNITPWSYTTPTTSSIITRLGTLLPANMDATPKIYTLSVGVTYAMYDAGNNLTLVTANPNVTCTAQLNQEQPVVLRTSDRCPAFKAITSSIATDRQICGAARYEWEFTQTAPTAQAPVTIQGGLGTNAFFLSNVPGMANGKTYSVRVRPLFVNGPAGAYGAFHCMKTTGAGMVMEENNSDVLAQLADGTRLMTVYPNPSSTGEIVLQWSQSLESDLKVKMYNGLGEVVFKQTFFQEGANSLPIQVANASSGMYLLEVELNGKSETHRLMINR